MSGGSVEPGWRDWDCSDLSHLYEVYRPTPVYPIVLRVLLHRIRRNLAARRKMWCCPPSKSPTEI